MQDTEAVSYDTEAYDEIRDRREAKHALLQQEDLMEELTGEDLPYSDDLGRGMRTFLWMIGGVFVFMSMAGFIANPIAGFTFAGILAIVWSWMVSGGKEISASAGGAGNMFRNQRIGRSPGWSEQREERVKIVETIVGHEGSTDLLNNLDDPDYVRTLKEALHRDEHGWTMSD
ncbi:hypothetical protein LCGC14_2843070 [marine sediment metagenome]|uniref:Uncharacterized protein n=1 Tax=marine sediment metagenome TaxID=412755 RepID=A0A0F8YAP7_9ZZZZ